MIEIKFDEINIDDTITVRHTASHTGTKIYETTGTVVRKFKNTIHLTNENNVNSSYELIKRTDIVAVLR